VRGFDLEKRPPHPAPLLLLGRRGRKNGGIVCLVTMKTLILGYGNQSRRDDGVGWFVLEQLA
jgi:hypothetical protein